MLRITDNDIRKALAGGIEYNWLHEEEEMTYECCDCLECDCTNEFAEEIERLYRIK